MNYYSMCISKNTSHNFPSRLLRFRTLWCTFTRFNPFFWPFTWFRSIMMDPCSIHRHKSTQQLFRIEVEIGQISLQSGHTNAFLVDCEQSRHPSCIELSHAHGKGNGLSGCRAIGAPHMDGWLPVSGVWGPSRGTATSQQSMSNF